MEVDGRGPSDPRRTTGDERSLRWHVGDRTGRRAGHGGRHTARCLEAWSSDVTTVHASARSARQQGWTTLPRRSRCGRTGLPRSSSTCPTRSRTRSDPASPRARLPAQHLRADPDSSSAAAEGRRTAEAPSWPRRRVDHQRMEPRGSRRRSLARRARRHRVPPQLPRRRRTRTRPVRGTDGGHRRGARPPIPEGEAAPRHRRPDLDGRLSAGPAWSRPRTAGGRSRSTRHASRFDVRPETLGMIGFSAGAFLAVDVALDPRAEQLALDRAHLRRRRRKAPVPRGSAAALHRRRRRRHPREHRRGPARRLDCSRPPLGAPRVRRGGHGFGMVKQGLPSDSWTDLFQAWLDDLGSSQASAGVGPVIRSTVSLLEYVITAPIESRSRPFARRRSRRGTSCRARRAARASPVARHA